jgi:hypothetical protein
MIAIAITGIAVCLAAAWFWTRKEHSANQERFRDRSEISPIDQIRSISDGDSLDIERALMVWKKIADSLSVPLGKLRLSDNFDVELAPPKGWEFDSALAVLNQELASMARSKNQSVDLASVKTIRDYLTLVCVQTAGASNDDLHPSSKL